MNKLKINKLKIFSLIIIICVTIFFITNGTRLLKKPTSTFVVEKGSISFEEPANGYVIRDEIVLEENDEQNGMVKIKYDGEKVAKGEEVFRYYSSDEDNLIKKITELDEQINKALGENESVIVSSDMISIESQIQNTLNEMYNTNEIRKLDEYLKKIEGYVSKKAQIAGEHSPNGSLVKNLIQKRASLEAELNTSSKIINSPMSGVVSYRVDGLEEYLKVDDFNYLNKKLLDSYNLKTGSVISQNNEKGKIVNNFVCYIATPINTERADSSKVGDKVTLRLANSKEVEAEISNIINDTNCKILVFKIKNRIEELIEYRKISFDIIWWKYSGFKISNSAIYNAENDLSYIQRSKARIFRENFNKNFKAK